MFAIFTHSATMFAVALFTLETDNSSRRTRRLDEQIVVHQFVRLIWILDNYVIEWLPSPVYEQINCPSKIVFTDGQVVEQIQTTCSSKILSDTFSHLMICPTKTIYSSKRLVRLLMWKRLLWFLSLFDMAFKCIYKNIISFQKRGGNVQTFCIS
jgi:hypothetical protein